MNTQELSPGRYARDVLLLGIGNILWADEGFGPRAAEAFNSDEVCALTLVYNPGAADEETQEISIKRGTYVTFVSSTGNLLYADAALTQPIDDTVSIDTNGEEMTVYVVPDVPLN